MERPEQSCADILDTGPADTDGTVYECTNINPDHIRLGQDHTDSAGIVTW